jgi:hypothetical protein
VDVNAIKSWDLELALSPVEYLEHSEKVGALLALFVDLDYIVALAWPCWCCSLRNNAALWRARTTAAAADWRVQVSMSHEDGTEPTNSIYRVLPAELVVRSVGFFGTTIDEALPFDAKRGVIQHDQGR